MTSTAPSPSDPDADTSLPPAFSTPRMLALGVGSGVAAVGAAYLAVTSDDGGQRALLVILAALSALLTGMFLLAAPRIRRARRDPRGEDARRLRESAARAPQLVTGWQRVVMLVLSLAYFATLLLRGAGGLSESTERGVWVLQVLLMAALVVVGVLALVTRLRSRRGGGER